MRYTYDLRTKIGRENFRRMWRKKEAWRYVLKDTLEKREQNNE